MNDIYSRGVEASRASARKLAGQALEALDFSFEKEAWTGPLRLKDGSTKTVRVTLPPAFPDALPEIFLDPIPTDLDIAHVDRRGKICISPDSGILLDVEKPDAIVTQALEMAKGLLQVDDAASQKLQIASEYSSYWRNVSSPEVTFICSAESGQGVVYTATSEDAKHCVVASAEEQLSAWIDATGRDVSMRRDAFLVRLKELPSPPPVNSVFTLRNLMTWVVDFGEPGAEPALSQWLKTQTLPTLVIIISPLPDSKGHVVLSAQIPELSVKLSTKGFRRGHIPTDLIIARAMSEPIRRPDVQRADASYLLERTGSNSGLLTKNVIVAGCGAVGSFVAQSLAILGVGKLHLVDHDVMAFENVHRHVLGVSSVGKYKATALAEALQARFPHLNIQGTASRIEKVIDTADLQHVDLCVFATGDETTQRTINRILHPVLRRVHVWIEPYGIGTHVLTAFPSAGGCFECLFRRDDTYGLVNMASFCAPGQSFQITIAGCAGTFTPFGGLDADLSALRAAQEAALVLSGDHTQAALASWCNAKAQFLSAGFKLSRRGEDATEHSTTRTSEFASPSCSVCGAPTR